MCTTGGRTAARCDICGNTKLRMIQCNSCDCVVHPTCLGMGKHAMPAGVFTCADCVRFQARLPAHATQEAAAAADMLVLLASQRTKDTTQATYAASLHRFVKWGKQQAGFQLSDLLPPGQAAVSAEAVRLFMAWASQKYKYTTIESTLTAVKDWHKSKGVDYQHLQDPQMNTLLASIKSQQGPAGLPQGKLGMSRPLLRVLVCYLAEQRRSASSPNLAQLYLRDLTWIVLGYFGMFRRSELIALQLRDVVQGNRYVELTVRFSKTDRCGQGAKVTIAAVSKDDIQIASILHQWQEVRKAQGAGPDDPLLTKWDLDSRTLSPLPITTGQALAERLKLYLTQLVTRYPGLSVNPKLYGMHSLRRGGVMAAWQAGVGVEKTQAHGRWRSNAVRAYMTATRATRLQVTQGM
jgi:integrase